MRLRLTRLCVCLWRGVSRSRGRGRGRRGRGGGRGIRGLSGGQRRLAVLFEQRIGGEMCGEFEARALPFAAVFGMQHLQQTTFGAVGLGWSGSHHITSHHITSHHIRSHHINELMSGIKQRGKQVCVPCSVRMI